MKTLVVNLWGGPGTGKSTNAALTFGKLKVAGINVELVHEYAKDLTWEGRTVALANQPYVMAKQQLHIERVQGQVQVIVTDSPLPFGKIYQGAAYTDALGEHILQTFDKWNNLNIFLGRDTEHHPYRMSGRSQSLEEAMEIDRKVLTLLRRCRFDYTVVPILPGESTANEIVDVVLARLAANAAVDRTLLDK